jgi:hypothetical protein
VSEDEMKCAKVNVVCIRDTKIPQKAEEKERVRSRIMMQEKVELKSAIEMRRGRNSRS